MTASSGGILAALRGTLRNIYRSCRARLGQVLTIGGLSAALGLYLSFASLPRHVIPAGIAVALAASSMAIFILTWRTRGAPLAASRDVALGEFAVFSTLAALSFTISMALHALLPDRAVILTILGSCWLIEESPGQVISF